MNSKEWIFTPAIKHRKVKTGYELYYYSRNEMGQFSACK